MAMRNIFEVLLNILRKVGAFFLTTVLTLILLFTLWRATEVLSIILIHIRQTANGEKASSTLLKKVFRQFCQLLMDTLMILLIFLIFPMIIQVPTFIKRLRDFYYLYKERRGFRSIDFFKNYFSKQMMPKERKFTLIQLDRNTFANICSFLDIRTLGNVSCVCSKLKELIDYTPIWVFQYDQYWKNYTMSENSDYKKLAIEGYLNFKNDYRQELVDEQDRNYRIGARAIVLEEFVLSILRFPHLVALPAKAVVYVLAQMNLKSQINKTKEFSVHLAGTPVFDVYKSLPITPPDELLSSFFHIQLHLVSLSVAMLLVFSEYLAFATCRVSFSILRFLSDRRFTPFDQVPAGYIRLPRYFYYLQFSYFVIVGLYSIGLCLFVSSCYLYCKASVLFAVLFCVCFINYLVVCTHKVYWAHFHSFRPWKVFKRRNRYN